MDEKKFTRKELEKKLTPKEHKFCLEYILDWNAARSARVSGYSEKAAKEIGFKLLTKNHIKQFIEFIREDYEYTTGVSKANNIKQLMTIANASISHLNNTWITLKEFDAIPDDQKAAIESIDTKTVIINGDKENREVEYVKIKMHPKITAINELNKMMGYHAPEKISQKHDISDEMKALLMPFKVKH